MRRYGDSQPVSIGDPPAGAGFTYVPATSQRERIEAVTFTLVTDGTIAARTALVEYLDSAGVPVAVTAAPFTQTATHTCLYSFWIGGFQFGAQNAAVIGGPLPNFEIQSWVSLAVSVQAGAAGDQIVNPRLFVCGYPIATYDDPEA